MKITLEDIAAHFVLPSPIGRIIPYGSGHINDTFCIYDTTQTIPLYILQRINHQVFTNIPLLKTTTARITEHIRSKLRQKTNTDLHRAVLTPLATKTGEFFFLDADGNYWGMYLFIQGSVLYDTVRSDRQAYQAGTMFGRFIRLLADFPTSELHESIPNFHNMIVRLEQFYEAQEQDRAKRTKIVQSEIDFVTARVDSMTSLQNNLANGLLPQRITHNDTKLNNILFDAAGNALCVIDLDTVMPGLVHYDFGDSIRSIASSSAEDETDPSRICLNLAFYTAYTRGFLEELHTILTPFEQTTLAFGAQYMTFIMGLRFLTDYLNGDVYYKIHYAQHNITRARSQFALLRDMERHAVEMQAIIDNWQNYETNL